MDKRRGPIAAEFAGPGPAAITLPILFGNPNIKESTKLKAPAYTFGGRFKSSSDKVSPSPNSYNTTGLTTRGKSGAPSASLHVKLRDLKKFSTPSPNSYNPQSAAKELKKSEPSYSFGIKAEGGRGRSLCPAPNAYSVPAIKESPAYSLAARAKENKVALVPGPGSYEPCNVNLMKKKFPAYSLGKRYNAAADRTSKPGPGAYIPEKINTKSNPPEYSFGVKHSKYIFGAKPLPGEPIRQIKLPTY